MLSGLFGANPSITLSFDNQDQLPTVDVPSSSSDRQVDKLYLFSSTKSISGKIDIIMPANVKKIEHKGIKAELIGQIELTQDSGNHYIFFSTSKELDGPGVLNRDSSYNFQFNDNGNDKQYESYNGINVILRYFIRIRITKSYSSITKDFDFYIQKIQAAPDKNAELKMEVGIEDCLHIEFKYDKSKFYLNDCISGKIFFLLVRIKIKHMELQILKRESTGSSPNLYNETEVITKFEIMDGAPIKGENVPIRLFLTPYNITPTYRTIHNKFSVKYYLNLVLVDEEERRYFKQQEITIWRKELQKSVKNPSANKPLSG